MEQENERMRVCSGAEEEEEKEGSAYSEREETMARGDGREQRRGESGVVEQ